MTTVLLDTNILIALEDADRPLDAQCAEMLRNAPAHIEFYYHPIQLKDIARDKNESRKMLFSSRINRYKPIGQAPAFDDAYFASKGWTNSSENDRVDNTLLACVVEPIVDYLVTNDKGILAKARRTGVEDHVLDLESFGSLVNSKSEPPELACVNDEQCHALDKTDAFFDSLRSDYAGFDNWLEGCARGQRKCWTIRKDGSLAALCIYKAEKSAIIDDEGFKPTGSILKLCTFKVDSGTYGSKMGERLLQMAFSYASQQGFNFIYLTVYEEAQPHLVSLLKSFGFQGYGHYERRDRVFGKYLCPQTPSDKELPKAEYASRFYPSFKDGEDVGKYLVPIRSDYHERLFPDISDLKYTLLGNSPEMYGSESNTIRKAYLCGAPIGSIEPGDLLLFYRSKDRRSIQVLGVVKDVYRLSDRKSIFNVVKGRTVYEMREIDHMIQANANDVLVLCFDLIRYFDRPVTLEQLRTMGMSHPQTICRLSDERYTAIIEAGK